MMKAVCDDPGRKRVICRRGCKYPERVMNSTKSNTSVMFCGSAAGLALSPYNYHLQGRTSLIHLELFNVHLFPVLKQQDNLSSHISPNVLRFCQENYIAFVCLPPNSTHLTQPLDIAYFRPLKIKWKQALTAWKESEQGKRAQCLPKEQFPSLLKKTLDDLIPTTSHDVEGTHVQMLDKTAKTFC
nr:unnamed protein product [Callosobruchus analis]